MTHNSTTETAINNPQVSDAPWISPEGTWNNEFKHFEKKLQDAENQYKSVMTTDLARFEKDIKDGNFRDADRAFTVMYVALMSSSTEYYDIKAEKQSVVSAYYGAVQQLVNKVRDDVTNSGLTSKSTPAQQQAAYLKFVMDTWQLTELIGNQDMTTNVWGADTATRNSLLGNIKDIYSGLSGLFNSPDGTSAKPSFNAQTGQVNPWSDQPADVTNSTTLNAFTTLVAAFNDPSGTNNGPIVSNATSMFESMTSTLSSQSQANNSLTQYEQMTSLKVQNTQSQGLQGFTGMINTMAQNQRSS